MALNYEGSAPSFFKKSGVFEYLTVADFRITIAGTLISRRIKEES